jgi:DNA-binding protein HU-beta
LARGAYPELIFILKEVLFVNKAELIANVAEKTGFTKKDAEAAVSATFSTIETALIKGEKIQLIGFGTFETRERKARQGRNPRKPEEVIDIDAAKAPVFKAGKALKDAVNR